MTTTIKVLEDLAVKIKNELDELPSVVGTGIYVIHKPQWGGLGYIHCETLLTTDGAKSNLHEAQRHLYRKYGIQPNLTAGKWCRWEWSVFSTSSIEYSITPTYDEL